jgi:hypothetical protein
MSKPLAIVAIACFSLYGTAIAQVAPIFKPNPLLTPGAVDPGVSQANISTTICKKGGYTNRPGIRKVSAATKKAVFAEYGIDPHGPGSPFEIDHLISLEISGSNDIKNLWPQSYVSEPLNAHIKDALEDHLHKLVCEGKVPLKQAQHDIATDWPSAYQKYMAID